MKALLRRLAFGLIGICMLPLVGCEDKNEPEVEPETDEVYYVKFTYESADPSSMVPELYMNSHVTWFSDNYEVLFEDGNHFEMLFGPVPKSEFRCASMYVHCEPFSGERISGKITISVANDSEENEFEVKEEETFTDVWGSKMILYVPEWVKY